MKNGYYPAAPFPHVFYKHVLDSIPIGIVFLDRLFTIVYANKWMETIYASQFPLIGKKCDEIFYSQQKPIQGCPQTKAFENGKPIREIVRHEKAQGQDQWLEISVFPLADDNGQVIGAVGHVQDVTGKRRDEEFLQDEINRWRLLVDQSQDGIVILDTNGKVYEANKKYAQMLGYSMEEVHELHVWDWDTQWTKEQLLEMIRTVDDSGDHLETFHQRKDGTRIDVEISTNGTVYRGQKLIFCVCRDVTERNIAEKEREKLIAELKAAFAEVKTLRGILPLCSFCKKVRTDKGYWEQVDVYIQNHSHADISHSVCPECMKKYYPEFDFSDDDVETTTDPSLSPKTT